jgi:uncharacterized protein with von Willebrand factor type A (vWA) domain
MKTYRYFAPAAHAPTPPDADTIMDKLADHVLERDSLDGAMRQLSKDGIEQAHGDSLDGLDKLASDLQGRRRDLLDEYSMDPLLDKLSDKLQSLVYRETEALREYFSAEQDKLDDKAASFLKKADGIVKKLEKLEARAEKETGDTPHSTSRIENTYEKLFLEKHEMQAESRALREEEANRMAALKRVSNSPAEALKELKDYAPVDPSISDELAALTGMADEIGAIERVHAQPGFSGDTELDLPDAAGLVKQVLGMERLGSKLRKGNLSEADELRLAETLGPEALAGVEMIGDLKDKLLRAGYIEETDGETKLSPRGIRRIGQKALADVFSNLSADRQGGHATARKGAGEPDIFDTKPYGFGDPLNIHLAGTLMNAVARSAGHIPLQIGPHDFEVYTERRSSDCSTTLLLDLSHTMSRDGKLGAAKKVVLALDSLIRARFPRDTLHIVGFATYARELSPEDLPHVGIDPGSPFTNMQDALRLAEELMSREKGRNRQALLITDGEPSAYCSDGELIVDYPPTEDIFEATLKEAARLTHKGISINTFMLDEQPRSIRFVERLTALNKGRAFFTTPATLGEYLLIDYLAASRR